jgi:ribA/ribD-fused uncharacterized protein
LNVTTTPILHAKTVENYFQAFKFIEYPELFFEVLNTGSPRSAFELGRDEKNKSYIRKDWHLIKNSIMKEGLLFKFKQNEDLKKKLLETGTAKLVEDSPDDSYWGIGDWRNGRPHGENYLGKILEEVRSELKTKTESNLKAKTKTESNLKAKTPSSSSSVSSSNYLSIISAAISQNSSKRRKLDTAAKPITILDDDWPCADYIDTNRSLNGSYKERKESKAETTAAITVKSASPEGLKQKFTRIVSSFFKW